MNQTDGQSTEHLFFKVNLDAIKKWNEPLIAQIGSDNFATLCVLAAFMDENKYCYPTLATIGRCLNVSQQAAGERVRKLKKCTINGESVIEIIKGRANGGKFDNNRYRILTSAISIFHSDKNESIRSHVDGEQIYTEEELRFLDMIDHPEKY